MSNNSDVVLGGRDIRLFCVEKLTNGSFTKGKDISDHGNKETRRRNTPHKTVNGTPWDSKWPLARPRMSLSLATKYRDVNRRLQMKQFLHKIEFGDEDSTRRPCQQMEFPPTTKKSSLEELKLELEALRDQENRRPNWLCQGISVRVISTRLGKRYLGQTADVIELKQDYTALIKFLSDGNVIYADQTHLQTAILGESHDQNSRLLIVNGAYRGCTGVMQHNSNNTSCGEKNGTEQSILTVKIDKGVFSGRVLRCVQADDVASLARYKL